MQMPALVEQFELEPGQRRQVVEALMRLAATRPWDEIELGDVAAEAGVSVSSVSRTLNGGIYTSAELHARIMRAVKRMFIS